MISSRLTTSLAVAIMSIFVALPACSDDEGGGADAASSCTNLCTGAGFGAGRSEVAPHEINCYCTGGASTNGVAAEACTSMCKDLGKQNGTLFRPAAGTTSSSGCQCD